jgi:AraC-like DNA-binding protein/quercetin dioxygenase-like cupin family protein
MLYQDKLQAQENPNEKRLSCYTYSNLGTFPSHCHIHLEIIYILDNKTIIYLDGKSRVCHKGDMIFVPMLMPHAISNVNDEPYSLMVLQLDLSLFLEDGDIDLTEKKMILRGKKLQKEIACTINANGLMGHIFSKLQHICESHHDGGFFSNQEHTCVNENMTEMWKLKGMIFSLFPEMMDEEIIEFSKGIYSFSDIKELSRIQSILKHMISHPGQKLSMEDASKIACMSYFNFCRTFKQVIGHSFIEYQNLLRIRQAEALLYETNMSIAEISELLNFGSISYFNRSFKKYNGVNPSDYRKKVVQKKANIQQNRK